MEKLKESSTSVSFVVELPSQSIKMERRYIGGESRYASTTAGGGGGRHTGASAPPLNGGRHNI